MMNPFKRDRNEYRESGGVVLFSFMTTFLFFLSTTAKITTMTTTSINCFCCYYFYQMIPFTIAFSTNKNLFVHRSKRQYRFFKTMHSEEKDDDCIFPLSSSSLSSSLPLPLSFSCRYSKGLSLLNPNANSFLRYTSFHTILHRRKQDTISLPDSKSSQRDGNTRKAKKGLWKRIFQRKRALDHRPRAAQTDHKAQILRPPDPQRRRLGRG